MKDAAQFVNRAKFVKCAKEDCELPARPEAALFGVPEDYRDYCCGACHPSKAPQGFAHSLMCHQSTRAAMFGEIFCARCSRELREVNPDEVYASEVIQGVIEGCTPPMCRA